MGLDNAEFRNYERELKYLLVGPSKLSLERMLHFLNRHGYEVVETLTREKHESYYDDAEFTIIRRGDVIRGSEHVGEQQFSGFMYKKNVSDPEKPYVSKLELGESGQYSTVKEFVAELGLDIEVLADPVLYAVMYRDVAVVEKNNDRLYVSFDKVEYFTSIGADRFHEEMLEIEDWNRPNSTDGDYSYDAHLHQVNKLVLSGELPIKLTTHTKPFRGYLFLVENREMG